MRNRHEKQRGRKAVGERMRTSHEKQGERIGERKSTNFNKTWGHKT